MKEKLVEQWNKIPKKYQPFAIAGVIVIVLALIGGGVALAMSLTKKNDEEVISQEVSAPIVKNYYYKLTGVKAKDEAEIMRPVVSVKIENSPDARPQEGLEDADIVWEELVEGGITRFVAMYNSHIPKDIGPVRSVRPQDAPITAPFGGSLVFSGGKLKFKRRVEGAGIQLMNESNSSGFHRVDYKYAPHNLFYETQKAFDELDDDHNAEVKQWQDFENEPEMSTAFVSGKELTSKFRAFYSSYFYTDWQWDKNADNGKGAFLRFQTDDPSMAITDHQHFAKNVIAFKVDVEILTNKDPAGTHVPESILNGKRGEAYLLSEGKYTVIKWSKGKKDKSKLKFKTLDGKPIVLAQGSTWINMVPKESGQLTIG